MKTHPASLLRSLAILLLGLAVILPQTASAMPMPGSYMTGVIQSVDHPSRQFVFREDGGKVHVVVYTSDAHFWRDAPDSSPAALRPGMHVRLRLHHPFFGSEFVREISLLGAAPPR